jgi:hypothetical protein
MEHHIYEMKSDYSTSPQETARLFDLTQCEHKVDAAAVKLARLEAEGRRVATDLSASPKMLQYIDYQITKAHMRYIAAILKRLVKDLEDRKVISADDHAAKGL